MNDVNCTSKHQSQQPCKYEYRFLGNDLWLGNNPDLIPIENLGESMDDNGLMHMESGTGRYSWETLLKNLNPVMDLFQCLLCSMSEHLRQVREPDSGNTHL
uniref:Uncharacterized protein n=1 Tax=Romanomermis culicivorax TaxID=13658 RepID=A0A915K0M2_ROMCU